MSSQVDFQTLVTHCKGCRLYCAVVDGARDQHIHTQLQQLSITRLQQSPITHTQQSPITHLQQSSVRVASLYAGIDEVADDEKWLYPYLVELCDNDFTRWLFECGWGNRWSIFVGTDVSFPQLRNHLVRLMFVSGREDGKNYFFRFFDPGILRQFLPTCNSAQLRKMFKHVTCYWMEKENKQPIYFYHRPVDANAPKTYSVGEAPYGRNLPLSF